MDVVKALEAVPGQTGTGLVRILKGNTIEIVQSTGDLSSEDGIAALRQCAYIAIDASSATTDPIKRITVASDSGHQFRMSQDSNTIYVLKLYLPDTSTLQENSLTQQAPSSAADTNAR